MFGQLRYGFRSARLPWLVAAAGLLFVAFYTTGLLLAGDAYLRIQSNVTYNVPALAALLLSIIPIRRSRGRERIGWICLAFLLACWQAGDWIVSYYALILDADAPVPGYADIPYYAGYLGFIAAIPLLALPAWRTRDPRWLIDAGLIVVVAGTLISELLLGPISHGDTSPGATAVALGYPLLDLGLLGALVITLYASGRHYSRLALVLCAATAVQVVTDSVYGYLITHGGYDNLANPAELGWILAYLLLAVCFALPEEKPAVAVSTKPSMTGLLLPYAAALPLVAWTVERLLRAEPSASLVAGTLATVALVAARQALTMRDNLALYRDLEREHRTRLGWLQAQSDLGEGMVLLDCGRIIMANDAAAAITGYSNEELLAIASASDFVPESERAAISEWFTSRVAGRHTTSHVESTVRHKGGDLLNIEIALKSETLNGQTRTMVLFRDVTARKRAEGELRASEATNRAILAAIPDMMFRISRDGIYLDFTLNGDPGLAPPWNAIIGRRMRDVLPPDLAARALDYICRALDTGDVQIFEYSYAFEDTLLDFEARMMVSGADEVVAIVRDITGRKQAEDALRDREQQLYMTFETSPDLIAIHEVDGRYRVANSAHTATLGYTPAELLRDGVTERIHPDDVAAVNASWRELVRGSGRAATSMRFRHADGRWIVLESHARALCDESGRIVGVVAVSRDITEREQAQQTLRRTLADLAVSKAQLEEKSAMLELTLVAERETARRDPLTNALNHGAISEVLRDLVSGAHTDMPACAVAMVDVDGMKAVNDTYGHQAGDMVLIAVANALGHSGALVGRYGGDEFVVILPGAGRAEAERYRDAVLDDLTRAEIVEPETRASIPVRVSVGLAIYPEEAQTVTELVGLSDNAMYAAKRQRSASGADLAGLRPMGDDRSARMVGELAPLLTSPGDASSKLRLVAHRLSVGAGYDAVDFTLFAPTPGAPLASNAFARIPADVLEAWNRRQAADDSADPHPLRTYFERSPRPVIIEDFTKSELVMPDQRTLLAAAGLRSGLVAPLIWRDEVVGMLAVGSKQQGVFSASDAQFVGAVATQVTAIVRMAQLVDELQAATARLGEAQAETVMMLAAAAEAHDRETGLHLLSIRTTAEALARELGYADAAVHDLGLAAVLHDIGKISVPDTVLSSSGSLQDDEWELMKRHTLWGAEFLSGKPGFDLAATVARSHHERWDGGGYPDGLTDGDIPEAAAIVTVADSFDAMTHDRPYKQGRPIEDAIQEIAACSGKQFSPRVVEALLRLHQRGELPYAHHGPESDRVAA